MKKEFGAKFNINTTWFFFSPFGWVNISKTGEVLELEGLVSLQSVLTDSVKVKDFFPGL